MIKFLATLLRLITLGGRACLSESRCAHFVLETQENLSLWVENNKGADQNVRIQRGGGTGGPDPLEKSQKYRVS